MNVDRKAWRARNSTEADLFRALAFVANLEIKRKSGGLPVDIARSRESMNVSIPG